MKKTYKLKNLCCPDCAREIEDILRKANGVKEVKLNFSLGTLKVESENEIDVAKIVKSVENDIVVEEACEKRGYLEFVLLMVSLMVFIFSLAFRVHVLAILSYAVSGFPVMRKAVQNVFTRRWRSVFDEHFLMSLASIGALMLGEYPEAAAVMVFYRFGEYLQNLAVDRSRRSIEKLMNTMPKYAWLIENGEIHQVLPEQLEIGQIILVKPGEKIPVDGVVTEGSATIDTSPITGESFPQFFKVQEEVKAGFIVKDSSLKIKVTKRYEDSTVSKLIQLVENATERKSKVEKAVTTFARYYTPVVLAVALTTWLVPVVFMNQPSQTWFYRSLILLVISCPCALMLAVPLTYFAGIGKASRSGILVKGTDFLDGLAKARVVLFDKTGTLTEDEHEIEEIRTVSDFHAPQLLSYLASAERYSNHPIARSIVKAAGPTSYPVENFLELPGMGIKGVVDKVELNAGNDRLLHQEKIPHPEWVCNSDEKSSVHIALNRKFSGSIFLRERVKSSARKAIKLLKENGIAVKMLTGDKRSSAERVANQLDVEFVSELLPDEKYRIIEKEKLLGTTIFVGDGINDVPSLARADVGIAMNSAGNDAAMEVADVVIASGEPIKVFEAIKIAKKTRRIVIENIVLAISAKLIFMVLAISGFATMWQGVFADVGVALLCVLNALRILR